MRSTLIILFILFSLNTQCTLANTDILFLWTNGSDPIVRSLRNSMQRKDQNFYKYPNANAENRFREWGELYYSLTLLLSNVKNIGRIFVLTSGEVPIYKPFFPTVQFIRHDQFIPIQYLPTFSSFTIWFNIIHLLPLLKLSDPFLLMDDDYYITQKLDLTEFTRRRIVYIDETGSMAGFQPKLKNLYFQSLQNSNNALRNVFPSHRPSNSVAHMPTVIFHSILYLLHRLFDKDIRIGSMLPFRSPQALNLQYLLAHIALFQGLVHFESSQMQLHFIMMTDSVQNSEPQLKKVLSFQKPFLCINDDVQMVKAIHYRLFHHYMKKIVQSATNLRD